MRYAYQATILAALWALAPCALWGQSPTVTNYSLLGERRLTRLSSQYTYQASLNNPGATPTQALTAVVTSSNSNIQIMTGLGNLHFPPVPALGTGLSTNTFEVIVLDRTQPVDFSSLQWSFVAPLANGGPNQVATVGSTVTLNASASTNPSGTGTLGFSWAFSSVPAGSGATLSNPASVTPTFVPDVVGNYVLTLTVSNGAGNDTTTVTVSTVVSPPVADAGPNQTIKAGATVFLNGSASTDIDGNPLTYAWSLLQRPSGSSAALTGANTVSPTFVADASGAYMAQLIVSDANGISNPSTVAITSTNTAPVANAGPDQSVAQHSVVQLDGSRSTDVDGNPLTYSWEMIALPAGSAATLSNPAIVNPVFTADLPGTYVAQLTVNDGFDSSSPPSTVTVSTNVVLPPVANAGLSQLLNGSVTLNGSGTDPQGLSLSFHWSLISVPTGSTATLSNPNIANPSFTPNVPGTYIAQLIVNNGKLNSAPSTVTVSSTATPPVANAGLAQNVEVGTVVTLSGSNSSDATNSVLTYSWTLLSRPSGSAAALLSANIVSPHSSPMSRASMWRS